MSNETLTFTARRYWSAYRPSQYRRTGAPASTRGQRRSRRATPSWSRPSRSSHRYLPAVYGLCSAMVWAQMARPSPRTHRKVHSLLGPTWPATAFSRRPFSTSSLAVYGTTVNLTGVGYQGLANTNVSIKQLDHCLRGPADALQRHDAAAPGQSSWATIWQDAVANQAAQLNCAATPTPGPCNAGPALTSLGSWSTSASLCQMVSIDGSTCGNGSLSTAALAASINALQTLTTEAEAANGTNALNVTSALGLTVPAWVSRTCSSSSTRARYPRWQMERRARRRPPHR